MSRQPLLNFVFLWDHCDMEYSQIAVLSIDLLDYDAETVRLYPYETFQSPWEWLSYLREEASKY